MRTLRNSLFSALSVSALALVAIPANAASSDPAHPWVSGTPTLSIDSNGNFTTTHPTYQATYINNSGYTVFDTYYCDSPATFGSDADRRFDQAVGNGNADWPLVLSGVSSNTPTGVTIEGASGCRYTSNTSASIGENNKYFMVASRTSIGGKYYYVFSDTVLFTFSGGGGGGGGGGGNSTPEVTPTPAKYSGPEFSGLSAKALMTGSSSRLEGKNLDEISSIEIGGKAATFKLDGDKSLDLTLPEGLAPGPYDLVINSSAGKLTHINAIRVREPLKSFSITSRSVGRISEEQYQEHALISAMQIPELNKARCVVNASSLAMAKAQAQRLCALVKAANPNIETTIVEARSTVKSDSVFARVSYGWNN